MLTPAAGGLQAVGDQLIDSVVTKNIPVFTTEEKYNETVISSVDRISAKLQGALPKDAGQASTRAAPQVQQDTAELPQAGAQRYCMALSTVCCKPANKHACSTTWSH